MEFLHTVTDDGGGFGCALVSPSALALM